MARTVRLQNSAPIINGKQKYAVNGVSFIPADTPLKFNLGSIPDNPTGSGGYLQTSVLAENPQDTVQSWQVDGHHFYVVG